MAMRQNELCSQQTASDDGSYWVMGHVHRLWKHRIRGGQLTPYFYKWGHWLPFDPPPILTCTKHVFLQRLGHYHAPSTPFTASITNTKLTRLCLTTTVSSTIAKWSFSALRRLKAFTRSTMYASPFTHLALLHVHQDPIDKIIWTLTICSRPNKRTESLFGKKGGIILMRAALCVDCSVCTALL